MDSYNKETTFHLPGVFIFFFYYRELLQMIEDNPDILKGNAKIGSIYGCPPCIWNGGRLVRGDMLTREQLGEVKGLMEHYNMPVRFTFTNCVLEEKHVHDTYGNILLEIFNNGNNEIICNKPVLEEYIRSKYGDNYRYISSTTKRLEDKEEQLQELEKDYHLVVLDYDHNKDIELLASIENKDKCEILCNPVCKPNCPKRKDHYGIISMNQLNYYEADHMACPNSFYQFWQVKRFNPAFISVENINEYNDMGFSNYKLEGRNTNPLDWIEIILYYLIKEQYKDEIRNKLQQATW